MQANAQLKQDSVTVLKLCCECNKEFELTHVERRTNYLVTNMENCPHCGARNDTWIKVTFEYENNVKDNAS